MNEQVDLQTILTRYAELRSKAGNLSYDEQLEFVWTADWCVKNQALADKLVEQAKENLENAKWDIVDRCGFPIEKVERMFGSTVVKLFTHSKAHNAWTHFVYEKRKEFAAKYDVYNPVVSKSQQNDKEKTAWVNKEVARAYNAVKADKNEFRALEDRTKPYNKAYGMSDIGVQFRDEMNAKSNSDSNFYALHVPINRNLG
ncbi:hypothetical protein INT45_001346 [Circinella minor]|uniref:Uncharacterized protein n=1 Tax=Circinella minor TaxID=1195481 RepID=A0A8H7RUI8_9FUNG|nr:hypothetical protein INT45_001346 [Circinella minor]